ncbi:GNAT family N-acetyltransferase [Dermacoccaceae bacterium W4C1]
MSEVLVRPRRPQDLPILEQVLAAQQPASRYPFRWPLPMGPRAFIVRETELRAWTAELAGQVVGHVSLTRVADDALGRIWAAGVGRPVTELVCVSVLFVDSGFRGRGLGAALLDVAEEQAASEGATPVLDVVRANAAAERLYRRRGWVGIGTARPEWLDEDQPDVLMMMLPQRPSGLPG